MVKRACIILYSILAAVSATAAATTDRLDAVRESFCRTSIMDYASNEAERKAFIECSDHGDASIDILLMQLYLSVQLPDNEIERVISLMQPDGSYSDINYNQKQRGGWKATLHITRLYALARAYCYPASGYYKSPELSDVLHKTLEWWCETKPVSPNWWHNEIGVPKKLASALVLIKDELSPEELDKAFVVLDKSDFGMTGQNRVALASIGLMKGLLKNDESMVARGVKEIQEEINVTDEEGIQRDWSFHQHGPQMQMGNYGLGFALDVSYWARILKDTEYAFSQEKYDMISHFVRDGLAWTFWKGKMDPSACGRQLHINGPRGKALAYSVAAKNMGVDQSNPVGAKYFPRSDFGVYRTDKWYASVRMQSNRTRGFEYTNGENVLAYFSADGTLLVMTGGDEYNNIFPIWDWRMLPGVTAFHNGKATRHGNEQYGSMNKSGNVHGKVEGDVMTATMEVDRDGMHAIKSYFFFPDIIICLGTDIRYDKDDASRITTTMDQCHMETEPVQGKNWVWHAGKAYISLDKAPIMVETEIQEGTWENMAPVYKGITASGRVFKTFFEHPVAGTGSYAYAIIPCADLGSMKKASDKNAPKVIQNDRFCQSVRYKGKTYSISHKDDK